MLRTRVIPSLLLRDECLVKTINFGDFSYIGDPCNTVRIFNEIEVDELIFLDIRATHMHREINYDLLADIANECFMPLAYGGGIHCLEQTKNLFAIGFEKVAINSEAVRRPALITEIADMYGSQAVIASVDVKQNFLGKYHVYTKSGKKNSGIDVISWVQEMESRGAGEILLTSIDREGTWRGFDLNLVKMVTESVNIPVIAQGGAGTVKHVGEVVNVAGASAVALGSMVLFQKKGMGVLVSFPDEHSLKNELNSNISKV